MSPVDRELAASRLHRVHHEVVTMRPAPSSERVAVRASLCLALVLVVLYLLHWVPLSLEASFGVLASVYGGRTPTRSRWRLQCRHAGILGLAVGSGLLVALSSHRSVLAVLLGTAWAVVAAYLSDRQRWIPPGPMFPVFAAVSIASVPIVGVEAVRGFLVFAATAALAIGLGVLEVVLTGPRRPPTPGAHPASDDPRRRRVHAIGCGIAVLLSGVLGMVAGGQHPYWAMPACLVPLSVAGVSAQLARGLNRTLGTLLGLPLAALLIWLPVPLLVRLLLVAVAQAITELLVGRHYGLGMVFITQLALVLGHVAMPIPVEQLLRDRTVETVIGSAVGIAVAIVTRPRPVPDA